MSRSMQSWFRSSALRPSMSALAGLLLLLTGSAAWGEEIHWRYDYNAGRHEAENKTLPILLDIGTDNCFWCVKLDTTTFRDPSIVSVINERFIPIKVHSPSNPRLTEQLRIQSFPTVVLAAPDGKILGTLEGFMESSRFQEHLQRALASLSNPEWMTRDYQTASKAVLESDYARAIALLKSVLEDGKTRPIQLKAQQLLQDLEQQAAGRLARAKQQQDKGHTAEAMETVTDLMQSFPGTHAAAEARQTMIKSLTDNPAIKAQHRTQRARDLLAQAREDYRTQQYLCCMERCEVLASNYPDLAEGIEAIQLANEIKNNPEWMRQACETLSDRLGLLYLSLAETWLKKGSPQQAMLCLERVIQTFPGTRQADAAQTRLAQIRGQPTRQADFKRP